MRKKFPVYRQLDQMDCGPTCLRMIASYHGKEYTLEELRRITFQSRDGVSMRGISVAAGKLGFQTVAARLSFEQLDSEATLPCILYWNQQHFVVLPPQNYDANKSSDRITIADPGHGLVKVTRETFEKSWLNDGKGIALLMEPIEDFYLNKVNKGKKLGIKFLQRYLQPYRKYIIQLFAGMLIGSLLSLVVPFLTQSLVDYGINRKSTGFIYLVLISQLVLFLGSTAIELMRNWLLLHMSARINMSIISDFLIKLMRLPIRFFDSKMVGDITQRISDHNRIEQFLTGTSLNTIFSIINLLVFSVVLGIYNIGILTIFMMGSLLSVGWMLFFMKKRRELDYARFQRMSDHHNSLYEIITGMQEIKMNNSENMHRWGWETIQARLFHINLKSMGLGQYQMFGASFFTQLKNILISFVAAQSVLHGHLTLGMMLSISYISGQMNAPVEQLLVFFKTAQDAKLSMERLREIHDREDEEPTNQPKEQEHLNDGRDLKLTQVSFRYGDESTPVVLDDISLTIPYGKVTAIVGASGCGKTTLMKLLLKFYEPVDGNICLGNTPLENISQQYWRNACGAVFADGYIFSDTIAHNIALQEDIDHQLLTEASNIANIAPYINDLPLGYQTKIGATGNGISSGQRQRLLIARAVYKQPEYIFLDEATSTLDANNEKVIIENMNRFFKGRTVVVIAHRLSTVKHADQIVVMERGKIKEIGTHQELTAHKGKYFELVRNQLELGN